MLILSRKENEEIWIGDNMKIIVVNIAKGVVKIGIEAPRNTVIFRKELAERIKRENEEASKNSEQANIDELSKKIEQ
ncbi:carbon storage regulator CsrA [Campylobacter gastrosuis]|uniref:Translational regulator CsrA n=1 Tax=Campylobacter gastrosuis TaxID=2974576 RepID=A0ABT7HMD7_9BACT|nr:carbon storage regulator CsrA [Campylobacter gastrosuis]MDL0087925.1 carbon storage regulator CsrA [Campylobacter gastrosuis]